VRWAIEEKDTRSGGRAGWSALRRRSTGIDRGEPMMVCCARA
jgi:hypothetical protein